MCGIVGAVAQRDITSILLEGLLRLEYRGYDSAGMAVIKPVSQVIQRLRCEGKVRELSKALIEQPISGHIGIAHTRWATHGVPSERNAHPHVSDNKIAVVHNGIIENHNALREQLTAQGYVFSSETDTEVVAHLIHSHLKGHNFLQAVRLAVQRLEGAFALAILHSETPDKLIAVRNEGGPIVIGLNAHENYVASDTLALLPLTDRFIYLEEGDLAEVTADQVTLYDNKGHVVKREIHALAQSHFVADRGHYRHFMLKEIYEQPTAINETLAARLSKDHVLTQAFGRNSDDIFKTIKQVQIAACGTSYHAGLVGRYWLEALAKLPCQVEIASELRYRQAVVRPGTLFIALSQSGETADTLAALRQAKQLGYAATLAICNVPNSSLVREADLVLLTHAGPEIGVASTKAFTTQLISLLMLTLALGAHHQLSQQQAALIVQELKNLPKLIEEVLQLDQLIATVATRLADKRHALFLGRGIQYPIAMEGALKLKELSYIHAEAYPAGELKHGPLALVDKEMPVVALAPNDDLLEKLKSNLYEVRARGGQLIIFADETTQFSVEDDMALILLPSVSAILAPIVYTLPLQLLAYHVAVLKGTDVDQPRNLAKSVTVE